MELKNVNVMELDAQQMNEVEGGIFPIVILGVVITAKTAAWIAAGGIFAAGVYVGYREAAANAK